MSVSRQRQFPELVSSRSQATSRNDLNVYSKQEVDASISTINLTAYALNSTVASVSGALQSQVLDLSGQVTTDIENLDLSLTQLISTQCVQSVGVSGNSTTVNGYLTITLNGISYKLATVA